MRHAAIWPVVCGNMIPHRQAPGQSRGFLVVGQFCICPSTIGSQPPHKDMGKSHTKFEPIELKDYSGWYVRITLPHGVQSRISYFKTEAEARTWIGENSALFDVQGPPNRPRDLSAGPPPGFFHDTIPRLQPPFCCRRALDGAASTPCPARVGGAAILSLSSCQRPHRPCLSVGGDRNRRRVALRDAFRHPDLSDIPRDEASPVHSARRPSHGPSNHSL